MSQPSGSGSEGLPYASKTASSEAAAPASPPQSAELLENVLRATLAICASDEPLDAADLERLRKVARRYAPSPLVNTHVVADLVFAVLEGHFLGGRVAEEVVWRTTANQIAQTLMDDPISRERLERFWTRLVGEAS